MPAGPNRGANRPTSRPTPPPPPPLFVSPPLLVVSKIYGLSGRFFLDRRDPFSGSPVSPQLPYDPPRFHPLVHFFPPCTFFAPSSTLRVQFREETADRTLGIDKGKDGIFRDRLIANEDFEDLSSLGCNFIREEARRSSPTRNRGSTLGMGKTGWDWSLIAGGVVSRTRVGYIEIATNDREAQLPWGIYESFLARFPALFTDAG